MGVDLAVEELEEKGEVPGIPLVGGGGEENQVVGVIAEKLAELIALGLVLGIGRAHAVRFVDDYKVPGNPGQAVLHLVALRPIDRRDELTFVQPGVGAVGELEKARASGGSKAAFDLLARGPRQRSDRKVRTLEDGTETDIYGAVLAAIAKTGPLTELTYEQLRAAMRDLMSEPPARHEITRVLEEMSRIARDQIDGEPVVDYDEELSTLHISDPFFAYYLRWGTSTPPPSIRDVKLPGIS